MQTETVKMLLHQERKKKGAQPRTFRPMSLAEAKELTVDQRVWVVLTDQTAAQGRVAGRVKTWKTRPGNVEVSVKYGLYDWAHYHMVDGSWTGGTLWVEVS